MQECISLTYIKTAFGKLELVFQDGHYKTVALTARLNKASRAHGLGGFRSLSQNSALIHSFRHSINIPCGKAGFFDQNQNSIAKPLCLKTKFKELTSIFWYL